MTTITIGSPVWGEDFFDREAVLDELWGAILAGSSVLLAAPRRVGKTSLMLRLRDAPRAGFENRVYYLDAEKYETPAELVEDLATLTYRSQPRVQRLVRSLLGAATAVEELEVWEVRMKLRERVRADWKAQGTHLMRELAADGQRCLLLVDELSVLLYRLASSEQGAAEAVDVLHWLRAMRQELGPALVMALGSSLGVGWVASALGASRAINDLRQVEVGPFAPDTARHFVRSLFLSQGLGVGEPAVEATLEQVGTLLPIFIQMMVKAVSAEARARGVPVDRDLARQCYEERVLGPEFRQQFEDYYQRLDRYYALAEARVARRLLSELAKAPEGVRSEMLYALYERELGPEANREGFDRLLAKLEEDFYLRAVLRNGERVVQFYSHWLRDWWRRFHGA